MRMLLILSMFFFSGLAKAEFSIPDRARFCVLGAQVAWHHEARLYSYEINCDGQRIEIRMTEEQMSPIKDWETFVISSFLKAGFKVVGMVYIDGRGRVYSLVRD